MQVSLSLVLKWQNLKGVPELSTHIFWMPCCSFVSHCPCINFLQMQICCC